MNETAAPLILVVDDARDIREPLAQYLRRQGLRTRLAANAVEARRVLGESGADLVLLDVMMPGEDGLSLCRDIAAKGGPPVILLTAMAEETDRVVGLELGADDYVVKPFAPRELLARIRAVLRRRPAPPSQVTTAARHFAGWRFDPAAREVVHGDGRHARLTSGEARLLAEFLDRPRAVLSREALLERLQGREAKPYDRAIDNTIARLRRKLENDPSRPRLLVTEWGGGYALAAEVEDDP
ncbi:response regulator [Profundibacterium mesophilum]|uniref:Two-component response regulator n=1 Tax=Profundibacterium mesophilum KAUST100406-0324 TaxID=1037889 RepID=A0A921NUD5_9RHOB|nr:response regulator transcription factor [Profundibacterium mesophilum]KAF0676819.1 Two-component response regulator [Profundibacterium mesophilum KAUST100406-0324]